MNKEQERAKAVHLFCEFKQHITCEAVKLSPDSYANADTFGDKWRDIIPYDEKIEQILIQKTKQFIFINVKPKQLKFIEKLTVGMADYLSGYTVHSNKFGTRHLAAVALRSELFEKSKHVRYLMAKVQEQNQAREKKLNQMQQAEPQQKRVRKRIGQVDINDQIKNFTEAQQHYIKMRGRNQHRQ